MINKIDMATAIERPLGDNFGMLQFETLKGTNLYGTYRPKLTTLEQMKMTFLDNYSYGNIKNENLMLMLEYYQNTFRKEINLDKENKLSTIIDICNKYGIANDNTIVRKIKIKHQIRKENNFEPLSQELKNKANKSGWQIFCRTLTGRTITISILSGFTGANIKELIYDKEDIDPSEQRLIYNGCNLSDENIIECPLSDTDKSKPCSNIRKIGEGSTIHLCLRLRGGMYSETSGRNGNFSPLKETIFDIESDICWIEDNIE